MEYHEDFNWEQPNFYIMHKLTNLFCLTIHFAKFNILASFILRLHILAKLRDTPQQDLQNGARCPAP